MSKVLSDIADYVTEKVSYHTLTDITYVGMDNMLPNRGGVTASEYVPTEGQFTAFRKGDVLIGNIRPYFKKIWLAEYDGGCSPDVLCIRAKHNTSPLFLYALLAQDAFFDYDVKGAKGSKMPRGDKDHIMSYPVPDVANADIIGLIIVTLYRKIQNNNAICADLEAMAKLLYDYWFIQFDFPDENGKPYKSSGGKMVWNEDLKREIPEGWDSGIIKDLGQVVGGATPSTENDEYYSENGIAWATPKDLSDTTDLFFRHGERDITEAGLKSCSTSRLPSGTVLMTSRAPIGYLAIAANETTTNQGFKSIIPNYQYGPWFTFFTLKTMMPYIKRYGVGSTFAEVSKQDVENIQIVLPDKIIVKKYSDLVFPLFRRISSIEEEINELASLRDFLLPMLMNGQVKVGG